MGYYQGKKSRSLKEDQRNPLQKNLQEEMDKEYLLIESDEIYI
jgi:hypothetical protein